MLAIVPAVTRVGVQASFTTVGGHGWHPGTANNLLVLRFSQVSGFNFFSSLTFPQ